MSDPITRLNAALKGRYHIERQLGEGGMATVYLADDLRHERNVALKVLKPELAAVVGAERFLAEIKTTANLQHPHILPLFDSGEADGFLFYVMPYVEGESLRERLDREHQLPVDDAVKIAAALAEALDYAHRHGVIHRDIKPGNVLIHDGQPVISDFGIALAVSAGGAGRLTETGLSLGTPHYMSPEQATGDASVGPATDIYAVGCVLYEMLVGSPPYVGSTPQAVLGKIITKEPEAVREHRKAVPANVEAAIQKALEKVPADRFGTAKELGTALENSGFRHREPAPSLVGGRAGLWNPLSIGATLAVTLFAGLWLMGRASAGDRTSTPEMIRFTLPATEGVVPNGGQMAISPDGRTLVFVAGGRLYRRDLQSLESQPIPGTDRPWKPFFSSDGQWIAFFDVGENVLKRVHLDGSGLQTLADVPASGRSGAWGDDGSIVFASTSLSGLMTLEPGGAAEPVSNSVGLGWMTALPGGRTVIGSWFPDDPTAETEVAAIDLASGAVKHLFVGTTAYYAAGHLLYWRDGGVWAVPFDAQTLEVRGSPTLIVEGVLSNATNSLASFAASDDLLVYKPGGQYQQGYGMPVWVDRDGNEEPIDIDPGLYHSPRISPDGSKVALTRLDGNPDIWVYDFRSGVSIPLTVNAALDDSPVWTPDGERIVFRSTRDGPSNLYWRSADGSDEVERLTNSPNDQRLGTVTPDGSTLLFEDFDAAGEPLDIWSMPLETDATPVRLLDEEYAEAQPTISPNGRFIAYESAEAGYPEIFVRSYPDLSGGRLVSTLDVGQQTSAANSDPREARAPVFSRDGTELFYQSGSAVVSVPVSTQGAFSSGVPRLAFAGTGWPFVTEGRHYDLAPDGRRFLRIRVAGTAAAGGSDDLVVIVNWTRLLDEAAN